VGGENLKCWAKGFKNNCYKKGHTGGTENFAFVIWGVKECGEDRLANVRHLHQLSGKIMASTGLRLENIREGNSRPYPASFRRMELKGREAGNLGGHCDVTEHINRGSGRTLQGNFQGGEERGILR